MWIPELAAGNNPVYRKIADAIALGISQGELSAEDKLPTHRALADTLGVTVGTITRGYSEAERRGLVQARVGAGTYVLPAKLKHNQFAITSPDCLADFSFNFPVKDDRSPYLRRAFETLAKRPQELNRLLEYQTEQGLLEHRQGFLPWLKQRGIDGDPENMLLTNGGQSSILLALMATAKTGDTILTEGLTFPGIKTACYHLNLNLKGVLIDDDGLVPEALEAACVQYRPVALYCTPTLLNPTTATQPEQRREQILAICQKYQVWLIEDDVNGRLPVSAPDAICAKDPERVLYVTSASKVLAGGLRVGLLHAPTKLLPKLKDAVRASCWMVNPLIIGLVCEWIKSGDDIRMLERQRVLIKARHQIAGKILQGYALRQAESSFHFWLELPENWRCESFVRAALEKQVILKGAELFAVGQYPSPQALRVSLSNVDNIQNLEAGLNILKELLDQGPDSPMAFV